MAVVQISRIQHRRGLQQDFPTLASAELGWSIDEQRLFIGNGDVTEGAPIPGYTEILTEHTDLLMLEKSYTFKGLASGTVVQTGPDSLHPIVRTLQDKIDDYVSVKDFGAIGDGIADDTAAIQRALERTYGSSQTTIGSFHHRTIYFPAGNYRLTGTINIPPFTRMQGEGKRTTVLQGAFGGPIAQFADSYGDVGVDFGQNADAVVEEYHISDMSFLQQDTNNDQSCLLIDGCFTATFNRVMFRGNTPYTQQQMTDLSIGGNNYYNVDRGTGIAAVAINNASATNSVRNLVFTQCDFLDHNYGIEINDIVIGVSVTSCFFDNCYYHIVAGKDGTGYYSKGISIYDNYFRWSAAESLYCGTYTSEVMSLGNMYIASGTGDAGAYEWFTVTPAVSFNSANNFSIADSFDRSEEDMLLIPNVDDNGYECYMVTQGKGIVNGRATTTRGHTMPLDDASVYTTAGLTYLPSNYSNIVIDYNIDHNSNYRRGTLRVTKVGSTVTYQDDFTETGLTGVELRANSSTGDIEYTSSVTGTPAILTYSINYLTA